VGRELGVPVILTGRVAARGSDLSISVELVDSRANAHIRGERYAHKISDVSALQAEISSDVSRTLGLRLMSEEERRLARRYTGNSRAYQAYLKGRYFWNKRNEEGFRKGLESFRKAVEVDANYALAYAGVADSYTLLTDYGYLSPGEGFPNARAAALKALELDDSLAEAHASLAMVRQLQDRDGREVEKGYRRAIALNPNYATAHHWLAV
jgi:tetratricopeptide (TPR) repeat protein